MNSQEKITPYSNEKGSLQWQVTQETQQQTTSQDSLESAVSQKKNKEQKAISFPGGLRMHGSRIIEPQTTYKQRKFKNSSLQLKQKILELQQRGSQELPVENVQAIVNQSFNLQSFNVQTQETAIMDYSSVEHNNDNNNNQANNAALLQSDDVSHPQFFKKRRQKSLISYGVGSIKEFQQTEASITHDEIDQNGQSIFQKERLQTEITPTIQKQKGGLISTRIQNKVLMKHSVSAALLHPGKQQLYDNNTNQGASTNEFESRQSLEGARRRIIQHRMRGRDNQENQAKSQRRKTASLQQLQQPAVREQQQVPRQQFNLKHSRFSEPQTALATVRHSLPPPGSTLVENQKNKQPLTQRSSILYSDDVHNSRFGGKVGDKTQSSVNNSILANTFKRAINNVQNQQNAVLSVLNSSKISVTGYEKKFFNFQQNVTTSIELSKENSTIIDPALAREEEQRKKLQKGRMSQSMADENESVQVDLKQYHNLQNPDVESQNVIKKMDVQALLIQAAKELKSLDRNVNKCIQSLNQKSIKLSVTTQSEIQKHERKVKDHQNQLHEKNVDKNKEVKPSTASTTATTTTKTKMTMLFVPKGLEPPGTTIEIYEKNPVYATVDAENRKGQIVFRFVGDGVPNDLAVYVSENYQNVTKENSSWSFMNTKQFTINPREQRIFNPKKVPANVDLSRQFVELHLRFETGLEEAFFQVLVTFPDEEQYAKRRQQARDQLEAVLGSAQVAEKPSQKMSSAMATKLKQVDGNDPLTPAEKEKQAEARFKIIQDKLKAINGPDKYETDVDYVEKNAESQKLAEIRVQKQQTQILIQKIRQQQAKAKRNQADIEHEKTRILQLRRWDILRHIKEHEFDKVYQEIEAKRWTKNWIVQMLQNALIAKVYKNFKAHQDKKENNLAKLAITLRLVRNAISNLKRIGLTIGSRLRKRSKQAVVSYAVNTHDTYSLRAKASLTAFTSKCQQLMEFKKMTYEFLLGIGKINKQMQNRLKSHKMKMDHLDILFERELRNMSKSAFNRIKTPKYKAMIKQFQLIQPRNKQAVLKEYFSMCKMVYRIRCTVAYYQDAEIEEDSDLSPLDKVKQLYNEDPTFAKMINIVKKCLVNIFQGTDPNQPLLRGQDSPLESPKKKKKKQVLVSIQELSEEATKKTQESIFINTAALFTPNNNGMNETQESLKSNKYDEVSNMPEVTETMHVVLGTLASFDVMTVHFSLLLDRIKKAIADKVRQISFDDAAMKRPQSGYSDHFIQKKKRKNNKSAARLSTSPKKQMPRKSVAPHKMLSQLKIQSMEDLHQSPQKQMSKDHMVTPKKSKKVNGDLGTKILQDPYAAADKNKTPSPMRNKKKQEDSPQKNQSPTLPDAQKRSLTRRMSIVKGSNKKIKIEKIKTPIFDESDQSLKNMFPEYTSIRESENKRLIDRNLPFQQTGETIKRCIPMFRYMPTRAIMQRLVLRCSQLPAYFEAFETVDDEQ